MSADSLAYWIEEAVRGIFDIRTAPAGYSAYAPAAYRLAHDFPTDPVNVEEDALLCEIEAQLGAEVPLPGTGIHEATVTIRLRTKADQGTEEPDKAGELLLSFLFGGDPPGLAARYALRDELNAKASPNATFHDAKLLRTEWRLDDARREVVQIVVLGVIAQRG